MRMTLPTALAGFVLVITLSSCKDQDRRSALAGRDNVVADTTALRLLKDSLTHAKENGRYQQALQFNERILNTSLKISEKADSIRGEASFQRSIVLRGMALPDSALTVGKEALQWFRNHFQGKPNSRVADALDLIGSIYHDLNNHEDALANHEDALDEAIRAGEGRSKLVANIRNHIGSIMKCRKNYNDALLTHKEVLNIAEELDEGRGYIEAETYNYIANVQRAERAFGKAHSNYRKSLKLFLDLYGESHLSPAVIYHRIGETFADQGEHDQALENFQRAWEIRTKILGDSHYEVGNSHNNLGMIWNRKGHFKKALYHYEKSLIIKKKYQGENHLSVANLYNNIGLIWRAQGDYQRALAYFRYSIDVKSRTFDVQHTSIGESNYNIALILNEQKEYEEALSYLEKCESSFLNAFGEIHPYLAIVYGAMSHNLRLIGEKEKALPLARKALNIAEQVFSPEHLRLAEANYELAGVLLEFKEFKRALSLFKKTLAIRELRESASSNIAGNHLDIGWTLMNMERFEEAKYYYDQALQLLRYHSGDPLSFQYVTDSRMLVKVLRKLRHYYKVLHKREPGGGYLDSLKQQIEIGLALEEFIQSQYTDQHTRGHYAEHALPLYEDAIEFYLENDHGSGLRTAFRLSEKTKARQLAEKVELDTRGVNFGLPEDLIDKERYLDSVIYDAERKKMMLMQGNKDKADTAEIRESRQRLFRLYEQRDTLNKKIKREYPRYFELRHNRQVMALHEVQDSLLTDEGDAFLQYFVGDSAIYSFLVLRDSAYVHKVNKDFPLMKWVEQFRCGILAGSSDQRNCPQLTGDESRRQYADFAHKLYLKLLQPIQHLIPEDASLTIVPDGALGYLPFDALLVSQAREDQTFFQYDYLLRHYTISYAYSATLWREMNYPSHPRHWKSQLLAVAPTFPGQDSLRRSETSSEMDNRDYLLSSLIYNDAEVRAIGRQFQGEILTGHAATKDAFLERAPTSRILHLSTHARADDLVGENSFLAFYRSPSDSLGSNWLLNRELYNLQLRTDLVVLSACETGIGELRRGEGIISLARGFSYAGAKSIVTSLWSANDRSTEILMEAFYEGLKEGLPKHESLRRAKMTYMKQMDNDRFRSPLFWAAFIPIGDMAPLAEEGVGLGIWWLLLLLPIVIWAAIRRRRSIT